MKNYLTLIAIPAAVAILSALQLHQARTPSGGGEPDPKLCERYERVIEDIKPPTPEELARMVGSCGKTSDSTACVYWATHTRQLLLLDLALEEVKHCPAP